MNEEYKYLVFVAGVMSVILVCASSHFCVRAARDSQIQLNAFQIKSRYQRQMQLYCLMKEKQRRGMTLMADSVSQVSREFESSECPLQNQQDQNDRSEDAISYGSKNDYCGQQESTTTATVPLTV